MRRRGASFGLGAVGLSAVIALGSIVAGAAMSRSATGDPASIAYYRTAVAKTNAVPEIRDVYSGYYWVYDHAKAKGGGPTSAFLLSWGFASRPDPSEVRATGTYSVRMAGGKSAWYTLLIRPKCASGSACATSMEPLEIFATKAADYWGYVTTGSQPRCWNLATGSSAWIFSDFRPGRPWWETYGRFLPKAKSGADVKITSIYPDPDGAISTETDTINAATRLFVESVVHVSKSTKPVYAPYGLKIAETQPKTPSKAPKVSYCK
jgi:hypothetical protein